MPNKRDSKKVEDRLRNAEVLAAIPMTGPGALPFTERRNRHSRELDRMSSLEIVSAMNGEDASVACAVRRALPEMARAVDLIAEAMSRGGRLIYVGAGTSGRLATLDAAECPPTFGIPARSVRAVIAGGTRALTHAVEGAEDSPDGGLRDLARLKPGSNDVVVGITASGITPYVQSALHLAQKCGAKTVALTMNPGAPVTWDVDVAICVETGPEIVAGSTRMKAGTAQKMVLNTLSTAAMVRLGRVYNNWMVDVALTNEKLRRRGLRILEEAAGATPANAARALKRSGNNLRLALIMLKTGASTAEARRRLRGAGGNLRKALGE